MRRIVTKEREYLVREYRKHLEVFHPEFLKGLRRAFGSAIYDKVIDYAEREYIPFTRIENPEKTLINLLNRENSWQKKMLSGDII